MRDYGPVPAAVIEPLLPPADLDRLRVALTGYTADAVDEALGLVGRAALGRGDLRGARRALVRSQPLDTVGTVGTLVRLFVLGLPVSEAEARAALDPLPLDRAAALFDRSAGEVRARLDVRPYGDWWVVSDFGSDVRPGPLPTDHVLGVGAASLTLSQATPRTAVGRALDLGTGCGVQALHLGTHADSVVATDISTRALRHAATTAALSGQAWDLRPGSLLEPVAGERFDLIVANPPFVVSPGGSGYDYRDSGLAGDGVSRTLVSSLPDHLAPGGTAQLLANWVVPSDGDWAERVGGWLAGRGCDAWVWQREVAEPGEYVALWLRDAGETPGTPSWNRQYDAWLDWFDAAGVLAVGMGLVTMWRSESADPVLVLEDVPQAVEQPVGPHLAEWIARRRWLAGADDDALLSAHLAAAPGLVRERADLLDRPGPAGWTTATSRLRQSYGLRWDLEVDDAVAALVAGCDGTTALRAPLTLLAASLGHPLGAVVEALVPVVRDLVGRGFLLPVGRS